MKITHPYRGMLRGAKAIALAPDVSASLQNGIVTLSGTTPDRATKSRLDSTVNGLKGVISVVDMTNIKTVASPHPPPPPSSVPYAMSYPDTVAKRDIDVALSVAHIKGVHARVMQSVVILTGNAAKKDMRMILAIANESHPKRVIDSIVVK